MSIISTIGPRAKAWAGFYKEKIITIERSPLSTLQIIPDRTVRNWNTDDLTRALYELYKAPVERLEINKWLKVPVKIIKWRFNIPILPLAFTYRPLEYINFDITLEHGSVRFWITAPERWKDYTEQKMLTIWPGATIKPGQTPELDPGKTKCAELRLKHNNFFH